MKKKFNNMFILLHYLYHPSSNDQQTLCVCFDISRIKYPDKPVLAIFWYDNITIYEFGSDKLDWFQPVDSSGLRYI